MEEDSRNPLSALTNCESFLETVKQSHFPNQLYIIKSYYIYYYREGRDIESYISPILGTQRDLPVPYIPLCYLDTGLRW